MAIKKNIQVQKVKKGGAKYAANIVGRKYGRLYVFLYLGDKILPGGQNQAIVLAQCECGHIGTYIANHIKGGRSKSCGCLQSENTTKIQTIHGHKRKGQPRGSRVYSLWRAMIDRCQTGKRYLDLGIKVCDEWKLFENFYRDMGEPPSETHTVDRIDNLKGYYKGNCRYATRLEQANNTRRNVWITIDGIKYTLSQAVRELGIGRRRVQNISAAQNNKSYHGGSKKQVLKEYKTIQSRIKRGWNPEDALFVPISKHTPNGRYINRQENLNA